jgi:hypothetical protein
VLNAKNWALNDPKRYKLSDSPVRDAYEQSVIEQPAGYENTAKVSEVVVPALLETALTGSPKSSFLRTAGSVAGRAARDTGLGIAGGEVGAEVGEMVGGEDGADLGRILGSAVAPGVGTRGGAKLATLKTGAPLVSRMLNKVGLGRLDPFNALPPATPSNLAKGAAVGATGDATYHEGADEAAAQERRMEDERYQKMRGR